MSLKSQHFIGREQTPAPHLSLCSSHFTLNVVTVIHTSCVSYAKKNMGLACNFRRLKDSEKSPVTALLMLVVACEGIAYSAEHLQPQVFGLFCLLS